LRGITMKIEKPEHSPPELRTLRRLPRQPVANLPRKQTEDTASPLLLRSSLRPTKVSKSSRAGSNSLLEVS
jgi:hypothetical protein